jgi:hypothetical protein
MQDVRKRGLIEVPKYYHNEFRFLLHGSGSDHIDTGTLFLIDLIIVTLCAGTLWHLRNGKGKP